MTDEGGREGGIRTSRYCIREKRMRRGGGREEEEGEEEAEEKKKEKPLNGSVVFSTCSTCSNFLFSHFRHKSKGFMARGIYRFDNNVLKDDNSQPFHSLPQSKRPSYRTFPRDARNNVWMITFDSRRLGDTAGAGRDMDRDYGGEIMRYLCAPLHFNLTKEHKGSRGKCYQVLK